MYLNEYDSEKYCCNRKVRLYDKKISDLLHDGHRFRNVILKGIKSLVISSWQKSWAKRTPVPSLVLCLHALKAEFPTFL